MNRQRRSAGQGLGPGGYGLLVPAATAPSRHAAAQLRGLLAEWGVRATVAPGGAPRIDGPGGGYEVLVFGDDAHAAYRVITTMLPDPHDHDVLGEAEGPQ